MISPRSPEAAAEQVGARVLTVGAADYPAPLLNLPQPPSPLYAIGDLSALSRPVVAIVGTRRATAYGERVAREMGAAFGRAGACVVSGMARGIDANAHHGALAAGGTTSAVLGTGVDVAYPVGHRALHASIAESGLLLSEFAPGAGASPGCFPRRNRIIAALAQTVIVIEAPVKSGALSTARHALDLGRNLAAVPGAIDSPQSAGSNALLRDGAHVIATVGDALFLAGLATTPTVRERDLTPDQRAVWKALGEGSLGIDALSARASLPARRCLAAVATLELAGVIECELTGAIRRI